MATLLTGATLVDLEPPCVERASLRVDGGRIVARGAALEPGPGDEVLHLPGRLVLPGLVSGHHRLLGLALRGQPDVSRARLLALEAALTPAERQALAAAAGLEGLQAGVTTVFHLQAAGAEPARGLEEVAQGLAGPGLRAVLACEVSGDDEPGRRAAALEASLALCAEATGRLRGALAFAQVAALDDDALAALARAREQAGALVLGALARDRAEEQASLDRFGAGPVDRLLAHGLVGPRSALAANVHLSWPQLSQLLARGPYLVHTARANMATQAGVATAAKFGVRTCLGTDLLSLDVLAEAQAAALRNLDAAQPLDVLRLLASGQRLAAEAFGFPVGPLREGAAADLLVLDYQPPTALDADSLASHLLHGLSGRAVESVMVEGLWRLWKRKPLGVDPAAVAEAARAAAGAAWARLHT